MNIFRRRKKQGGEIFEVSARKVEKIASSNITAPPFDTSRFESCASEENEDSFDIHKDIRRTKRGFSHDYSLDGSTVFDDTLSTASTAYYGHEGWISTRSNAPSRLVAISRPR